MAPSIYLFEDMNEYVKYYKTTIIANKENNFNSLRISDMFIKKDKLISLVTTEKLMGRPDMTRSVVILDDKLKEKMFDGSEILVKHGDLTYNPRNNRIEFMKKFLRKPKMWLKVDKKFGSNIKKRVKINTIVRFYDFETNRIILIQKYNEDA